MEQETITEVDMGAYVVRDERWRMCSDEEWCSVKMAYNQAGDSIGDLDMAIMLCDDKGILPQKSSPEHNVCSIGFCQREQKWYGWSHRAIHGFEVGDSVSEGDCCAESGWVDGITPEGDPDPDILPVGFVASTLDDAKLMAIAFASSVS
jgi:hypothetical protein